MMRLIAFRNKRDSLKDGWFTFDAVLVCLMTFETWILAPMTMILDQSVGLTRLGILRVVRIFKVTRVARMAHLLPELQTITRGIFAATRAVASCVAFNGLIIYVV